MKKLIGALALAAMVATSAFAELSFGGWVRTLPTFVGSDGDGIKTSALTASWGGPFWTRFDATWTSDDGKAGAAIRLNADAGGVGLHDDVGIWLKPIDMIKIQIGGLDNFGGLRGDLCYGSWDWVRPFNWVVGDEGLTFDGPQNGQGLGLLVTPMDALKIAVTLPLANTIQRADHGFGNASVAAAYTIDGIGTIKAGFFGKYNIKAATAGAAAGYYTVKDGVETSLGGATADEWAKANAAVASGAADSWGYHKKAVDAADECKRYGKIEAAFDLTAVDRLFVTVGGSFTIAQSDWFKKAGMGNAKDGFNEMVKIGAGASYGITEAFKLSGSFAMLMFNGDVKNGTKSVDPVMQFGVGADYALSDVFGISGDVRMLLPNNDMDAVLSFLVGLNGQVTSNASLGIGFQGLVGLGKDSPNDKELNFPVVGARDKADKFAWCVPIKAQLSF